MPPLSSSESSLKSIRAASRGWRLRNPGGLRSATPDGTDEADVLTSPLVGLKLSIVCICMLCVLCVGYVGESGGVFVVPPLDNVKVKRKSSLSFGGKKEAEEGIKGRIQEGVLWRMGEILCR